MRPTPSPDGKSLAFIRRVRYKSTLFVLDLESGKETPIYDGLDRDMQETWADPRPLSDDGLDARQQVDRLLGRRPHQPHRRRVEAGRRTSRSTSTPRARIQEALRFPDRGRAGAASREDAALGRPSRRTASRSSTARSATSTSAICPNGTPHRLTKQTDHFEFYPAWSRDGKSIVYTTWNDQTLGTIRIAPAIGGEGRVITDKPGHYIEPAFSPDGSKVVYRTTSDGFLRSALWSRETGIYVVPSAGGAVEAGHEEGRVAAVRRVERPRLLHDVRG